jgi:hypothetical protein
MSLVRMNRVVRGPWHSRCSFDAQEDDGESFHVTIVESASVTIRARNLEVLLYSKTDTPIGHDDVATLVKMKGSRTSLLFLLPPPSPGVGPQLNSLTELPPGILATSSATQFNSLTVFLRYASSSLSWAQCPP